MLMLGNYFLLDSSPRLLIGKETAFILAEHQQKIKHLLPLEAARHSTYRPLGALVFKQQSANLSLVHSEYVILSGHAISILFLCLSMGSFHDSATPGALFG